MVIALLFSGLIIGLFLGYQDVSILYEALKKNQSGKMYLNLLMVALAIYLGVVFNTEGTSVFISDLSQVHDLKFGAIVSVSAIITVLILRKRFHIISVSHALIGSIIGWLLFTDLVFPITKILHLLTVWLLAPVLSFWLASLILLKAKKAISKWRIHIFKIDRIFKILTVIALLISVFSFGANNSANITGVFIGSLSRQTIQIINFKFSALSAFFILSAWSIIIGFFIRQLRNRTNQKKLIFNLSPEANLSILMAYAIVFFLFSSAHLRQLLNTIGITGYELIPINSFHILTGAVMGISHKKGYNIYKKEVIINLPIKSLLTPLIGGLISFTSLFSLKLYFGDRFDFPLTGSAFLHYAKPVKTNESIIAINNIDLLYNIGIIVLLILFILLGYLFYARMQRNFSLEKANIEEHASAIETEKDFFLEELKYSIKTGERLKKEVNLKTAELEKYALQLVEKEQMLRRLKRVSKLLKQVDTKEEQNQAINEINLMINESLNLAKERESFYLSVSNVNADFLIRLTQQFSTLTEKEKRLITLIKLGLSSKEIASLNNISSKSVEMNRYRLRKKLNIPTDISLSSFISKI